MTAKPFSLFSTFLHLQPGGDVAPMRVDKTFWQRLKSGHMDGRLAGGFRITRSTSWEMHPDGDEVLYLLSGALDVVLEQPDGNDSASALQAGRAFVVPRGVWHRLLLHEPGQLLFFTPGPRTEHRSTRRRTT